MAANCGTFTTPLNTIEPLPMRMKTKHVDKLTRTQLNKLPAGGLKTYLQRMWHASDGVQPIFTMQRKSGILLEVHTMQEKEPTYMLTTSGKRSRVNVHELAETLHALHNWLNNTKTHGAMIVTWFDMKDTWQPTEDERGEIISDLAFSMPLDEWQDAWLHRHPDVIGKDIAHMVMAAACVEMLHKVNLMQAEYNRITSVPESYGISMRHGSPGLLNNEIKTMLQTLQQKLQNAITHTA